MKKEILFLTNVHGDEPDATEALKKIEKANQLKNCEWTVANPRAVKAKKRFIDADMNRVAPGSLNSKKYELKQIVKVLEKANKFKYVIDLHGSKGNQGAFTIIPNPTLSNIILASLLPVKHILIWPFNSKSKYGPIMKFINCGVGIEFGPKETSATRKLVLKTVREVLDSGLKFDPAKVAEKEFYFVKERVRKVEDLSQFHDFERVETDGEEFYPVFVGAYKGIAFYKTKKIDFTELVKVLAD